MVRRDLLKRLEAIEATNSRVSPVAVSRAMARLKENGEWPKNPALLKIVKSMRVAVIGMNLTTVTGTPVEDLNLGFKLTPEETADAQRKWEEIQEDLKKEEAERSKRYAARHA